MRLDVLWTGVQTRFFTQLMPFVVVVEVRASLPFAELLDVLILSGTGEGLLPPRLLFRLLLLLLEQLLLYANSGDAMSVGGEGCDFSFRAWW
jgi:hypothetical protein